MKTLEEARTKAILAQMVGSSLDHLALDTICAISARSSYVGRRLQIIAQQVLRDPQIDLNVEDGSIVEGWLQGETA